MEHYRQFNFTDETKAVLPYVTDFGEYHSLIIEGQSMYEIPTSTLTVVDTNLRYNHSSLRGAKDSAACLLGPTNMNPIVLNAMKRQIWFSSQAYQTLTNVWLALHHIAYHPQPLNEHQTVVYLTGNWELVLPVRYKSFIKRVQNAHMLRSHTLNNSTGVSYAEKRKRVELVCNGQRVEYKIACENEPYVNVKSVIN